ncbi:MAG: hypothetical protein ACLR0U_08770 [Enterocloster clostridioformis]
MEIQECLGAENQLGIDIWKHKYCYQDETLEQWLDASTGLCDCRADTGKEGSGGRP